MDLIGPDPKKTRARARLIDAALAVFARQWLDAASINEITREADMANDTVYLHFKDKEELTSIVALSVVAEIVTELDAAMAATVIGPKAARWRR